MADPTPTTPAASPPAKPPSRAASEMRFGSYPLFVLFWPLVVVGEICAVLLHVKPEWQGTITWVYITMMMTCFMVPSFRAPRGPAAGTLSPNGPRQRSFGGRCSSHPASGTGPSVASSRLAHSLSRGPRTGWARYARASSREAIP